MKIRRHWKVILNDRDRLILRDLFYSKGLNLEILTANHFKGLHISTVKKRMNRLFLSRLIEKRFQLQFNRSRVIFYINDNGLKKIENDLSGKLIRRELKSSNPEHDLEVAKIYYHLLHARGLNDLKLENEIQCISFGDFDGEYEPFRRLNTDIYLSLQIKDKSYKVAIEYERSQKENGRWTEYLLNYHMEDQVDIVLYICKDLSIKNSMLRIEAELAKSYLPKIYFCSLEEFFRNESIAIFQNGHGKSFNLNFHD